MLKIDEIKISVDEKEPEKQLLSAAAKKLKVPKEKLGSLKILRRSLDSRHKEDLRYVYSIALSYQGNETKKLNSLKNKKINKYIPPNCSLPPNTYNCPDRPVIIGAGPAGLFCGLVLAEQGLAPLIIERGKKVTERSQDVQTFWQQGKLLPDSNVQFGEGGAGTFSDGKLNTGTRDPRHRRIIADFIQAGAPKEIAYLAKPHIGSDNLPGVVKNLRQRIEKAGGEFMFSTTLTDIIIEKGAVSRIAAKNNSGEFIMPCQCLVLAIGHSARDTYQLLYDKGLEIQPKPFSLGLRIEHKQKMINQIQYGTDRLGAADYKLAVHLPNGRSVYSFCMCPGGLVVGAASEPEALVTNGMSPFNRDGENANSALLVGVKPEDFPSKHPLAGMYWQRQIEQECFRLGGSNYGTVCQKVADFLAQQPSSTWGNVEPTYLPAVIPGDAGKALPSCVSHSLREALPLLDNIMPGFACPDALLTAAETRSSAPVRIVRNNKGQTTIGGIFPAGEGSGYAGGIMSAAADGMKIAEFILNFRK